MGLISGMGAKTLVFMTKTFNLQSEWEASLLSSPVFAGLEKKV